MKTFSMLGASLTLLLFSVAGYATPIQATYTVNLNGTDPGLKVQSANVADNPFSFNLAVGTPFTFDLFKIWTDENTVNVGENGDDGALKPISVDFRFSMPEMFNGSVNGTTSGFNFLGFIQKGELNWHGPADFYFGSKGDGHLRIALSDETFNEGPLGGIGGLFEGEYWGATVQATVTLVQDATAVPEPGTLGLLGLGLLGLAAAVRHRRRHG